MHCGESGKSPVESMLAEDSTEYGVIASADMRASIHVLREGRGRWAGEWGRSCAQGLVCHRQQQL